MNIKIPLAPFRLDGSEDFEVGKRSTQTTPFYENKKDYKRLLEDYQDEIDDLQNMMYAHNKYSLLLVFQAMDAAGKDGTIRRVMSGINPHGVVVHAFKKPSEEELEHDYLWRTTKRLPQRGKIGIFNRSYYEEVLVVKVHPGILTHGQRIPAEHIQDIDQVWQQRYQDIRQFETFLHRNGTQVIKFFLHLSKDEQKARFLDRLNTPSKNWKFSEHDVKERQHWDAYQTAYEDCINATATPESPWYVIPADDKRNMRLIVCETILQHMRQLDMHYPEVKDERKVEFEKYRTMLEEE
ncbi:MAG: polyphosphate kinase 2 family protein [Bacteroidota bacterium]